MQSCGPPGIEFETIALNQGSPTLLLESYRPTDFSSNPNQTHLNQLIKVFRDTCHYRQVCCSRVGAEVFRTVALQEQGWRLNDAMT